MLFQFFEDGLKIIGGWSGKFHVLILEGVDKTQGSSMKELPFYRRNEWDCFGFGQSGQGFSSAIIRISGYRVVDACQVNPDLVGSSGL